MGPPALDHVSIGVVLPARDPGARPAAHARAVGRAPRLGRRDPAVTRRWLLASLLVVVALALPPTRARAQELGSASLEPEVHGPDIELFGARSIDPTGLDRLGFGGGVA